MRHKYMSTTSFLDLLLLILLFFVLLFVLAFISMNIKTEAVNNVESKAEFIITVSWPEDAKDDVDTYVEDPVNNIVNYRSRECGLMHLDRDDLGHRNDTILTKFGKVLVKENKEQVTIRGIVPGEFIVNVHMYLKIGKKQVPVDIKVDKLNPFSTVIMEQVILERNGDEVTVCRFTVDKEGSVVSVNKIPKYFTRR